MSEYPQNKEAENLSPYDTGARAEPKVWSTRSLDDLAPIARDMEADRYGHVDFNNENGESMFTVWVERNERGAQVMHVRQLGPTPVALRIHGEGDHP